MTSAPMVTDALIWAVLAGAGIGVGCVGVLRAMMGVTPRHAGVLQAVDAAVATPSDAPVADRSWWGTVRGQWLAMLRKLPGANRLVGKNIRADLQLVGIDEDAYLLAKVTYMTAGLAISPVLAGLLVTALDVPMPFGIIVVFLGPLIGSVLPDGLIRRQAKALRESFSYTLMTYLDLVALRTASGSGVSEALRDASAIGSGYCWRRIRAALQDARMAGRSPALGLADLGDALEVPELRELAAQLMLVAETGAQTEATLRSKAQALRSRVQAELHGEANAKSTSMTIGQVLFAVGFLILLGFPALSMMMTA